MSVYTCERLHELVMLARRRVALTWTCIVCKPPLAISLLFREWDLAADPGDVQRVMEVAKERVTVGWKTARLLSAGAARRRNMVV